MLNGQLFPRVLLAAGIAAAAALLTACSSARRDEPIAGPMSLSDTSLQRGKTLYDIHCYKCHGEGDGGLGPKINDKPLPQFLMRFQVRHGLGAMPSFSDKEIKDSDLNDILNYIVALRHHGQ